MYVTHPPLHLKFCDWVEIFQFLTLRAKLRQIRLQALNYQ